MKEADFIRLQKITSGMEILFYAVCLALFLLPFIKRKDRQRILFSGALFFCVRGLSRLFAESVNFLTGRYFVKENIVSDSTLRSVMYNYIVIEALQVVVFSVFLFILGRELKKCRMTLTLRELFCLFLTPLTGILFVKITFRLLMIITQEPVFEERYLLFFAVLPALAILFYAGILTTLLFYRKKENLEEERRTYFVERQQIFAMQERIGEVESFYDEIRRMKHEMRNHMTNLKGLALNGKYEDMYHYLSEMDRNTGVPDSLMHTGNAVTDVILYDRQKAAQRQDTDFQAEFFYPQSDGYSAYDIGIILNNLLENALEACEKMKDGKKYIFLSGRQKKKFFLIQVKNSFKGEALFDAATDLPLSTKDRKEIHGIGLPNVRREVEKYRGDLEIEVSEHEFCVTVLLQEKEEQKG